MAFAFVSTHGDAVRSPTPNCTERAFGNPQKSTPAEVRSDSFCSACGTGVATTLREVLQAAPRTAQLRPTQRADAAFGVHRPAAGVSTPDVSRPLLFGDSVLAWVRCSVAFPLPAAPLPQLAPPPRPASLVLMPRPYQCAHGGLPPTHTGVPAAACGYPAPWHAARSSSAVSLLGGRRHEAHLSPQSPGFCALNVPAHPIPSRRLISVAAHGNTVVPRQP